jgi:hypothetical protein
MSDKPKRKRSERFAVSAKWRFRLAALLYFLFFIHSLTQIGMLLGVLTVLGISVLGIGSYFVKRLSKLKEKQGSVRVLKATSAFFGWILLTTPALIEFTSFLKFFLSDYNISSSYSSFAGFLYVLSEFVDMLLFLLWFGVTYEISYRIMDFMLSVPNAVLQKEKRKNVMMEAVERKLKDESDIPLDLLAESESTEQKMK